MYFTLLSRIHAAIHYLHRLSSRGSRACWSLSQVSLSTFHPPPPKKATDYLFSYIKKKTIYGVQCYSHFKCWKVFMAPLLIFDVALFFLLWETMKMVIIKVADPCCRVMLQVFIVSLGPGKFTQTHLLESITHHPQSQPFLHHCNTFFNAPEAVFTFYQT